MEYLSLGHAAALGSKPYFVGPYPGAKPIMPTPFGPQTGHIARPGELGATPVWVLGPGPVDPATYGPRPEQMAYADEQWRRRVPGYGRPAPWAPNAVPVTSPTLQPQGPYRCFRCIGTCKRLNSADGCKRLNSADICTCFCSTETCTCFRCADTCSCLGCQRGRAAANWVAATRAAATRAAAPK